MEVYSVDQFSRDLNAVLNAAHPDKIQHTDRLVTYGAIQAVPEEFKIVAKSIAIAHRERTASVKKGPDAKKVIEAESGKSRFSDFMHHVRKLKKPLPEDAMKRLATLADGHVESKPEPKNPEAKFDQAEEKSVLVYELDLMRSVADERYGRKLRDVLLNDLCDAERACKGGPIAKPKTMVERLAAAGYIREKGLQEADALAVTSAFVGADYAIRVPFISAVAFGDAVRNGDLSHNYMVRHCHSFQTIPAWAGEKRFATGTKTAGLCHPIGTAEEFADSPYWLLVEGMATALSVYESTGYPVLSVGGHANFINVVAGLRVDGQYQNLLLIGDAGIKNKLDEIVMGAGRFRVRAVTCPGGDNTDLNDIHKVQGLDAVASLVNNWIEQYRELNQPKKAGFLMSSAKFAESRQPPKWLVKGWIQEATLSCIVSDPGSYKSFFAVDLATSLSLGVGFHGHRVRQTNVLMVLGEGGAGFTVRQQGLHIERGYPAKYDDLHVSTGPIDLLSEADCQMVADYVAENEIELVIFDTLSRNFCGNENDSADVAKLVFNCTKHFIELGCAVLLIHHSGHGDKTRGRGSSVLPGAVDTLFVINRVDEETVKLSCQKQKDAEPLPETHFKRKVVSTPFADEDGEPLSTLVLEIAEGPDKRTALSKQEADIWTVLQTFDKTFSYDQALALVKAKTNIARNTKRALNSALSKLCTSGAVSQFGEQYILQNP